MLKLRVEVQLADLISELQKRNTEFSAKKEIWGWILSQKSNLSFFVITFLIILFLLAMNGCSLECDLAKNRVCFRHFQWFGGAILLWIFCCKKSTQSFHNDCSLEFLGLVMKGFLNTALHPIGRNVHLLCILYSVTAKEIALFVLQLNMGVKKVRMFSFWLKALQQNLPKF